MKITSHTSSIRTLKSGHPCFHIYDKYVSAPRAGFEINSECPSSYRSIILQCLNNGWLTPVANVSERELLFIGLADK
jgi:hypothetical protein